jgi:nucleotide-binding universal stress UspA family protein
MKIVVAVDGSPSSKHAVEWCAAHAPALDAEIVAVHSIELPLYAAGGFGLVALPVPTEPDRDAIGEVMQREWCGPLTEAGVSLRCVVADGSPAGSIIDVAKREEADLVVTGRRGLGGFAELLLGSTSHELAHHLDRPLVIVP